MTGPQVIMSCYACEPGRGSEPGVGFTFARALAAYSRSIAVPAVLLTRPHTVAAVRASLAEDGLGDWLTIEPVSVPFRAYKVVPRNHSAVPYLLWQVAAARRVLQLATGNTVLHHVTFASANIPTSAALLARRIPVVFGPAGTTRIRPLTGPKNWLAATGTRLNLSRSAVTVAQSTAVSAEWLLATNQAATFVEPNAVVEHPELDHLRSIRSEATLVSVGLLIPRKRHDLAIRALAEPPLDGLRLKILGDGPLRQELYDLVSELGLQHRVDFLGWVDRDSAMREIAQARALLLLSDSEGAPWTVAEAQALGTPVVVRSGTGGAELVQLGGQGYVLDESDGPESLAQGIKRALDGVVEPVDRWSESRLPGLLGTWYARATNEAARG
jgi:glycosyltransferase involved in cell wall biosynthesis